MQTTGNGAYSAFSADPACAMRRYEELEILCREIIMKLPPEEQAIFREYRELLRFLEDGNIRIAFRSGVRIGERKQKK